MLGGNVYFYVVCAYISDIFGGVYCKFGVWLRFGEALELGIWRKSVTFGVGGAGRVRVGTGSFQKGAGCACG